MKTTIHIMKDFHGTDCLGRIKRLTGQAGNSVVISPVDNIDDIGPANFYIVDYTGMVAPDVSFLSETIKKTAPATLIIADGGHFPRPKLIEILESPDFSHHCRLGHVVLSISCAMFLELYSEHTVALTEQVSVSDAVYISHSSDCSTDEHAAAQATARSINPHAAVYQNTDEGKADAFIAKKLGIKTGSRTQRFLLGVVVLSALFFVYQLIRFIGFNPDYSRFQSMVTVFLSILLEAFPFILIGILFSSIIQQLIPANFLERIFRGGKISAYLVALVSGIFFPVCDCATVPVTASLIKKGVPPPVAVTFLLAAPLVNPIVIASTLYAFPGQPLIAVYRVFIGLSIALLTGLILSFMSGTNKSDVVILSLDEETCCHSHHNDHNSHCEHHHGTGKLNSVLKHATGEFFEVGIYLIIGALISSIIQTYVPKAFLYDLGGNMTFSLLIMMAAAFILSICSTSDAFIARTFTGAFPLGAVMGFMVMGPMLDMKNLLLLSGKFNKLFVFKLVFIILMVSYIVIMLVSNLILVR